MFGVIASLDSLHEDVFMNLRKEFQTEESLIMISRASLRQLRACRDSVVFDIKILQQMLALSDNQLDVFMSLPFEDQHGSTLSAIESFSESQIYVALALKGYLSDPDIFGEVSDITLDQARVFMLFPVPERDLEH